MARTTVVPIYRGSILLATALLPLGLLACGKDAGTTRTATEGASVPTVVNASVTSPAETPATVEVPPTYEAGEAAFRSGEYDRARHIFESYLATRPENPWGHYMLGMAAWKGGDLVVAEGAFNQAIQLDSAHTKSFLNSARVLLDLGRNREALERARQARALDSSSTDALRLIARAHHSIGDADSAIEAYRETLLQDDRDVWALNNLGVLYLDKGEPELALPPLARAIQLRSTAPVFQNNFGIALERTGHIAAARKAFAAALQADSSYTKASVSLARVNTLVADPADVIEVDELAQLFRMQLGIWRDNAGGSADDSVVGATSPPDTVKNPRATAVPVNDQ
jgi:tetratricopeptide (TPR) repeat protein